jgi:hypothetical protein
MAPAPASLAASLFHTPTIPDSPPPRA